MKEEIRYALWMAHNKRCVYTGNLIANYSNLEIDHIIPKSLTKDKFAKHGLSNDYDIENSFDNLLPTTRGINSFLKRNRPFSLNTEKFFREIALKAIPRVENERIKFRNLLKKNEKEAISNHKKQYEFAFTESEKFETKYEFTNREDFYLSNHYWNSKNSIAINAHIPSKYEEYGNCVISIKSLDTMISLNHQEIIELIEQKNEQDISMVLKRGESYNNTKTFTVIYTNAVHLPNTIFNDLMIMLDHFLTVYEENQTRFIDKIQAGDLKKSSTHEGFELMIINRNLWKRLLDYSRKYDIDNGDSPDFFFSYNGSYLIALDETRSHIRFTITPASTENDWYNSFQYPDNEVKLIWNTPSIQDLSRIENGSVWTAKQVFDWLTSTIKLLSLEDAKKIKNKSRFISSIMKFLHNARKHNRIDCR